MEISSELLLTAAIAATLGLALGSGIGILGSQNAKNALRRRLVDSRAQLHQQQQNLDPKKIENYVHGQTMIRLLRSILGTMICTGT